MWVQEGVSNVFVGCGGVLWYCVRRWLIVVVLPPKKVCVTIRAHRPRVLAPAAPAVAGGRHPPERGDAGVSPVHFVAQCTLLVHVRVVASRVVFSWVEVRVTGRC